MPLVALRELARRRRQAETLAKMLATVEEYLAAFEQEAQQRELTPSETDERELLEVRRQRIAASISEAREPRPAA